MTSELIVRDVGGIRVAFVAPTIPDSAPSALRAGIARRRIMYATGECPCGARLVLPNRAERRKHKRANRAGVVPAMPVEHEAGCPASDEACYTEIAAWRGTR